MGLLLPLVALAAATATARLELPAGEDPGAWRQAARLAGIALGACGTGAACATLHPTAGGWTLSVLLQGGGQRVLPVRAPVDEAAREEITLLAAALLADLATPRVAASPVPAPVSPAVTPAPARTPPPVATAPPLAPASVAMPTPPDSAPVTATPPVAAPAAPVAAAPPTGARAPVATPTPPTPVATPTPTPPTPVATPTPTPPTPVATPTPTPPTPVATPTPTPTAPVATPIPHTLAPPAPAPPSPPTENTGASPVPPPGRPLPLAGWLSVTPGVAWRAGLDAGPAFSVAGGVRAAPIDVGLQASFTPRRALSAIGDGAALTLADLAAGVRWSPAGAVAPVVGLSLGGSWRSFSDTTVPVAAYLVPTLALDTGVAVAVGPTFALTPCAHGALDLDRTTLARGATPAGELTPWEVGAGLTLSARFP